MRSLEPPPPGPAPRAWALPPPPRRPHWATSQAHPPPSPRRREGEGEAGQSVGGNRRSRPPIGPRHARPSVHPGALEGSFRRGAEGLIARVWSGRCLERVGKRWSSTRPLLVIWEPRPRSRHLRTSPRQPRGRGASLLVGIELP